VIVVYYSDVCGSVFAVTVSWNVVFVLEYSEWCRCSM